MQLLCSRTGKYIGLPLTNTHNVRSTNLTFHIPHAGVLHGLAGYFEAVLYGDVGISIHPDRQEGISPNMLSWFPMFFPFKVTYFRPRVEQIFSSLDVSLTVSCDIRSRYICQTAPNSRYRCGA